MSNQGSCISVHPSIYAGFQFAPEIPGVFQCAATKINATVDSPFGAKVKITQLFTPSVDSLESLLKLGSSKGVEGFGGVSPFSPFPGRCPPVFPGGLPRDFPKFALDSLKQFQFQYQFPIPPSGSITAFRASIGTDRKIVGKVVPSSLARKEFDNILENDKHKSVGLATVVTDDIFQVDLGNIPYTSTVEVELEYFSLLEYDIQYDGYRFFIPTYIFPRYGPEVVNSRGATVYSSTDTTSQTGIFISVKLNSPEGKTIEAVSHKDSTKVTLDSATYVGPEKPKLENDFVIIIKDEKKKELTANLSNWGPLPKTPVLSNLLTIDLCPQIPFKITSAKEIIFLIDCSGSMTENVATLKDALQLYLSSLPVSETDCDHPIYLNFVSFGSSYEFLWPHSRLLNNTSFEEARKFLEGIDANMGGTEILQPLREINRRIRKSHYYDMNNQSYTGPIEREIIVLTDGEVSSVDSIAEFLGNAVPSYDPRKEGSLRVHSFGVGDSVSHSLLDTVAQMGRGIKQTVLNGERMELKVSRLLQTVLSTPVIECAVYWSVGKTETNNTQDTDSKEDFEVIENYSKPLIFKFNQELHDLDITEPNYISTPKTGLFPIFSKTDSKLYIFTKDASAVAPSVKVVLQFSNGSTTTYEAPVVQNDDDISNESGNKFLFTGGARSLISALATDEATKELDDDDSNLPRHLLPKYSRQTFCESIGETFGLVSPWTSLIAVEELNGVKNQNVVSFEHKDTLRPNASLPMSQTKFGICPLFATTSMQSANSQVSSGQYKFDSNLFGLPSSIGLNQEFKPSVFAKLNKNSIVSHENSVFQNLPPSTGFSFENNEIGNVPGQSFASACSSAFSPSSTTASFGAMGFTPKPQNIPESEEQKNFKIIGIVTRACNFDGSFDVTPELYSLLSPAHSQPYLATIDAAREPTACGYVALAVIVYLEKMIENAKQADVNIGDSLKLLLDKVNRYVNKAYGGDTQKIQADRAALQEAFSQTS